MFFHINFFHEIFYRNSVFRIMTISWTTLTLVRLLGTPPLLSLSRVPVLKFRICRGMSWRRHPITMSQPRQEFHKVCIFMLKNL